MLKIPPRVCQYQEQLYNINANTSIYSALATSELTSAHSFKEPRVWAAQSPDYLSLSFGLWHPTLHPMNKSMLVVHNRAPLLSEKGEGHCIPPLTSCLQQILNKNGCFFLCFHPLCPDIKKKRRRSTAVPELCSPFTTSNMWSRSALSAFLFRRGGLAMKTGISGDPARTMWSFSLSDKIRRLMLTGCLQKFNLGNRTSLGKVQRKPTGNSTAYRKFHFWLSVV